MLDDTIDDLASVDSVAAHDWLRADELVHLFPDGVRFPNDSNTVVTDYKQVQPWTLPLYASLFFSESATTGDPLKFAVKNYNFTSSRASRSLKKGRFVSRASYPAFAYLHPTEKCTECQHGRLNCLQYTWTEPLLNEEGSMLSITLGRCLSCTKKRHRCSHSGQKLHCKENEPENQEENDDSENPRIRVQVSADPDFKGKVQVYDATFNPRGPHYHLPTDHSKNRRHVAKKHTIRAASSLSKRDSGQCSASQSMDEADEAVPRKKGRRASPLHEERIDLTLETASSGPSTFARQRPNQPPLVQTTIQRQLPVIEDAHSGQAIAGGSSVPMRAELQAHTPSDARSDSSAELQRMREQLLTEDRKRNEELGHREWEVKRKEREIERKVREMGQKERELEQREGEVERKVREIGQKERELEQREGEVERKVREIGQKERQLEQRRVEVELQEREFDIRYTLSSQHIQELEAAVTARDQELAKKDTDLATAEAARYRLQLAPYMVFNDDPLRLLRQRQQALPLGNRKDHKIYFRLPQNVNSFPSFQFGVGFVLAREDAFDARLPSSSSSGQLYSLTYSGWTIEDPSDPTWAGLYPEGLTTSSLEHSLPSRDQVQQMIVPPPPLTHGDWLSYCQSVLAAPPSLGPASNLERQQLLTSNRIGLPLRVDDEVRNEGANRQQAKIDKARSDIDELQALKDTFVTNGEFESKVKMLADQRDQLSSEQALLRLKPASSAFQSVETPPADPPKNALAPTPQPSTISTRPSSASTTIPKRWAWPHDLLVDLLSERLPSYVPQRMRYHRIIAPKDWTDEKYKQVEADVLSIVGRSVVSVSAAQVPRLKALRYFDDEQRFAHWTMIAVIIERMLKRKTGTADELQGMLRLEREIYSRLTLAQEMDWRV